MKLYINKCRQFLIRSAAVLLLVFAMVLSSCERDEIAIVDPILIDNDCDTLNVSYSFTVKSLFDDCVPCHNNSSTFGGVNLEDFDNIKSNKSKISNRILSRSHYFTGSDCERIKIQAWINQGSQNN
jgi:hypothetical protein